MVSLKFKDKYGIINNKFKGVYNKYKGVNNTSECLSVKYSESDIQAGRKQFTLLVKLLFENRSLVYLDMSLDDLLSVSGDSTNRLLHLRGYDRNVIREVYSSYAIKYLELLKSYLIIDFNRSAKDFLVSSFINDHIHNLCSHGTYRVNLLVLDGINTLEQELQTYFRSKISEANSMFVNRSVCCTAWKADYNDKLFDISFLSNRDLNDIYWFARDRVSSIIRSFINIMRKDGID